MHAFSNVHDYVPSHSREQSRLSPEGAVQASLPLCPHQSYISSYHLLIPVHSVGSTVNFTSIIGNLRFVF